MIDKSGFKKPKVCGNSDYDHRNLLELKKVYAAVISTPWL